MDRDPERHRAAHVPHAAPPVDRRVAVADLRPVLSAVDADEIPVARDGSEVEDRDDALRRRLAPTLERHDAVVRVVAVDPFEPARVEVELVERGLRGEHPVQVPNPEAHARVPGARIVEQVPVEARVVVPLLPLAELPSHEEELLAGQGPHVRKEEPQVRRHLPGVVSRHFRDQRLLQVHDLVVRQRQDEVFRIGVHPPERELAVVKLAVDGIELHVVERVVHPAHVPLHREAEAADVGGPRDHRPGRGLLGDRHGVGEAPADLFVQLAEEDDRVDVLPPAELVRHPLARLPGKVEIDHRGDRVDTQAVDVKAVQPVESRGEQEAPDLVPAVVEDAAPPVGLIALPPVGMFVQVRPVEVDETVLVGRKVRRHPVEEDADAGLVQRVDEIHEVLGRPEARRRREVAGRLVAPGAGERMLRDRQELDVREAHRARVLREQRRSLAVRQRPVALVGHAAPGAQVDLVDGHRRRREGMIAARPHPLPVAPRVVQVPHDRARAGRHLMPHAVGVGLVDRVALDAGEDAVLVDGAPGDSGHETVPDAGASDRLEQVLLGIPAVEVAHDRDRGRVRRPDRELRAGDAAEGPGMRAELLVEPGVVALVEEKEVVGRQELFPVARRSRRLRRPRPSLFGQSSLLVRRQSTFVGRPLNLPVML